MEKLFGELLGVSRLVLSTVITFSVADSDSMCIGKYCEFFRAITLIQTICQPRR